MNKNDLYIEYARVIEMCKGTSFEHKPWVCVKLKELRLDNHPRFINHSESYQFAIAILEDKPVFAGDTLYDKENGRKYIASSVTIFKFLTWQPPKTKRTFVLNGVELPCPVDWQESSNGDVAVIDGQVFWFKNKIDADLVRDTLSKIFREARDKP